MLAVTDTFVGKGLLKALPCEPQRACIAPASPPSSASSYPTGQGADQTQCLLAQTCLDPARTGAHLSGAPASGPVPVITLSTPGGSPACRATSASSSVVRLASSEGFTTQQLPAASAGATFQATISTARGTQQQA
jgi:hypothetical protein